MNPAIIDKDIIRAIRQDINNALVSIGEKYGLSVSADNASYSKDNITFKLNLDRIVNGQTITKETAELSCIIKELGISQSKVDGGITFKGQEYAIVGYSYRKPVKPWTIRCKLTGKMFVAGNDIVLARLK